MKKWVLSALAITILAGGALYVSAQDAPKPQNKMIVGEVIDVGIQDGAEERVARMEDTRMKYGGVRRH